MRSALLSIGLTLGLATAAAAQPLPPPPGPPILRADQIGQIFCLSRLGDDEAPIRALLSDMLTAAIDEAEAMDVAWAQANPGDKPPLGDGIPWQSWPDYAPACTVGIYTLMLSDARVEIQYSFPEEPDADFVDTLLLKSVPAGDAGAMVWRIDNIAYATGSDLRTALAEAFAD